jgi:hypothetical protein
MTAEHILVTVIILAFVLHQLYVYNCYKENGYNRLKPRLMGLNCHYCLYHLSSPSITIDTISQLLIMTNTQLKVVDGYLADGWTISGAIGQASKHLY